VEETLGDFLFYEIETRAVLYSDTIDFDIEFLKDGVRSDKMAKSIHNFYSANNPISEVVKLKKKPILLIGDELGTIRAYKYPNTTGSLYYVSRSDQLQAIHRMVVSVDQKYLLTVCQHDKTIMKYRLTYKQPL
jgi:hypothetical protein